MIKYCGNCGQGYEVEEQWKHVCDLPRTILPAMQTVTMACPHCGHDVNGWFGKEIKITLEKK